MICVDNRAGSKELADLIPDSILVELPFGDVSFEGNGPDGKVEIGIERKRIGDLVNSIATGRLSGHQIPGMLQVYYRSYLVVEGVWRESVMNRGGRGFSVAGIIAYLSTMEVIAGIIIKKTKDISETADLIQILHNWWGKKWKDHKSHLAIYKPPPIAAWLSLGQPSLIRRIASELPHIGLRRSIEVEKRFRSVKELMEAKEEEWTEIEGVGGVTAREIIKAIKERRK